MHQIPTGDAPGGLIGALRQLKYWVLLGQSPEVTTKLQHKGLWSVVVDRWRNGQVPTMEELDESMSGGGAASAEDLVPIDG